MPHTAKGLIVSRQRYLENPTGQVMSCQCVATNIVFFLNSSFMGWNENIQEADGGVVSPQPNWPVNHGTTQKCRL